MGRPGGKRLARSLDLMDRQALLEHAAAHLQGELRAALKAQAEQIRQAQAQIARGACPSCGGVLA